MNKTIYNSLFICSLIIIICIVSYNRIIEGFEDVPSLELAKSYIDAAQLSKKDIANVNINIATAKTDIDGISNALSNTATRIMTAISLIVSRTGNVIAGSTNSNTNAILLNNVFMVARISRDVLTTAKNVLSTLSNMIAISAADRALVPIEWTGTIDTIKNAVLSIQKIASVIIDISPKLSILGTETSNTEVIRQLAATQEQTNNDATTAQLGVVAVKDKIAEVKRLAAEREAITKAAIDSAEAAQTAAVSRINTADYLSYAIKASELAQAVVSNPVISEANKVIWRTKAAERKAIADTETARVAAEKEAARIAAEKEAARIAAEKEAARIAAEKEAARIAAEKEAAQIAAEKEAARLAQIEADKKAAIAAALAEQIASQQDADRMARDEAYKLAAKKAADELAAAKLASAKLAALFSNVAATNAAQAAEIAARAEAEVNAAAAAKAAAEAEAKKAEEAKLAAANTVANAQNTVDMYNRPVLRLSQKSVAIPAFETAEQKAARAAQAVLDAQAAAAADAARQQAKTDAANALAAAQQAAAIQSANAQAAADKAAAAEQAAIAAKAAADKAVAAKAAASNAIASAAQIAEDAWKNAAPYGCRNLITSASALDNMTCNENEYIYGFQKVNNAYQYTCCSAPKGIDGSGGLPGFQGPIGRQGPQGAKGREGPQGQQGMRGLQGAEGEKGAQGEQGIMGIQGAKGDIGIPGLPGDSSMVSRNTIVKQIAGPAGRKGDVGPMGPTGIRGEQGPEGPKGWRGMNGMNGLQGDQGDIGERGERGPPGKQGKRGKMADIVEEPSITSYLKKGFNYVQDKIKNFIISKQNQSIEQEE